MQIPLQNWGEARTSLSFCAMYACRRSEIRMGHSASGRTEQCAKEFYGQEQCGDMMDQLCRLSSIKEPKCAHEFFHELRPVFTSTAPERALSWSRREAGRAFFMTVELVRIVGEDCPSVVYELWLSAAPAAWTDREKSDRSSPRAQHNDRSTPRVQR